MRRASLLAIAALCACGKTFVPYSYVDKLRVLGVAADSPMLHPGEVATLSDLVVDPSNPAIKQTTMWIGCDPDPQNLGTDPCSMFTTVRDPTVFFGGCVSSGCPLGQHCNFGAQVCVPDCTAAGCAEQGLECDATSRECTLCPGGPPPASVHLAGVNSAAAYGAPFHDFTCLPPGDIHRLRGLIATIFGIVLDQEVVQPTGPGDVPRFVNDFRTAVENARNGAIEFVVFLKRIPIVDVTAQDNANPGVQGIEVDGSLYKPGGVLPRVEPGKHYDVNSPATPGSAECFHTVDAQGNPVQDVMCPDGTMGQVEQLIAIWFTTGGGYDHDRTAIATTVNGFTAPKGTADDPIPCSQPEAATCDRMGTWWVTLQDGRGGAGWITQPFYVCDPNQPSPAPASVSAIAVGQPFTVRGSNLDQILDVALGAVLVPGTFDPESGDWSGVVPAGTAPGPYTLTLRGKNCTDVSQSVTVQ